MAAPLTPPSHEPDLLRFAAAGSVDDGKSTLIGRLLYAAGKVPDDQLIAAEQASWQRGGGALDLALITDGLRAEREQGITIDVAYRFFATSQRRFVVLDTPGHVQYTRNTVTGMSAADLALLVVDVEKGLLQQACRHLVTAALLGVPHVVIAVNKMDLAGFAEARFQAVEQQVRDFAARLGIVDLVVIPVSALYGDNVVDSSARTPWYRGPTLLYYLEHVHLASSRNLVDVRFPVQWVVRPMPGTRRFHRAYAGQLAGGILCRGDEVVALPSGFPTRVASLETFDGPLAEAYPPMSVLVALEDDLDVGRGDMICRVHNRPTVGQDLDVMLFWLGDRPIQARGRYLVQHTTNQADAIVTEVLYRLDVTTLHREHGPASLGMNDIGRALLRTSRPLLYDPYRRNRVTGSLILIDLRTNHTVAGGVIL